MMASGEAKRNVRVLLIEDNADDEFLAVWALKQAGVEEIMVFRDGKEALDGLLGAGFFPDLILLDLNLPKIDGREVLRRVRENPGTRSLPVLILTSSEDIGDKEVCRRHGIVDFISKPLTVADVKRVLGPITMS
jgi:CheY-like chemotaxis protein